MDRLQRARRQGMVGTATVGGGGPACGQCAVSWRVDAVGDDQKLRPTITAAPFGVTAGVTVAGRPQLRSTRS